MNRPNLFIVGAPKCGTTAWYEYLRLHPDIYFPNAKEPHYFCTDFPNFRWAKTEEEYLKLFVDAGRARIVGEASVQYLYSAVAAANIRVFAPEARILIFLRQPGDFLVSYHNQLLRNLDEDVVDFAKVWRDSKDPAARRVPQTCREPRQLDYRAVGRFSEQVARYVAAFPPSQIRIVDFEEWTQNPRGTYLNILAFIGVEDDGREHFPRVHKAKAIASTSVARLTQRPPDWVLGLTRRLRHITGRERLGIAKLLRRVNYRQVYGASPPAELIAEIDAYFTEDQRALAKLRAALHEASFDRH